MSQPNFPKMLRTAEARRKFLVGSISTEILRLRSDAADEVCWMLEQCIKQEVNGLEQAKRETERRFGPALHRPAVKVR